MEGISREKPPAIITRAMTDGASALKSSDTFKARWGRADVGNCRNRAGGHSPSRCSSPDYCAKAPPRGGADCALPGDAPFDPPAASVRDAPSICSWARLCDPANESGIWKKRWIGGVDTRNENYYRLCSYHYRARGFLAHSTSESRYDGVGLGFAPAAGRFRSLRGIAGCACRVCAIGGECPFVATAAALPSEHRVSRQPATPSQAKPASCQRLHLGGVMSLGSPEIHAGASLTVAVCPLRISAPTQLPSREFFSAPTAGRRAR